MKIFHIAIFAGLICPLLFGADSKDYKSNAGVVADAAGVRNPDDGSKTGKDSSVPAILERFVMGDAFSPDFEEGAFSWKGKRFNAGNSRAVRARFERFLSLPPEEYETDRTYRETLAQIEDLLQVINADKNVDKTYQAWRMLYDAAKFPADAEGSLLVANQVYNAWSVRGEHEATLVDKTELERLRRAQERTVAYWANTDEKQARDRYHRNFNKELKFQKLELEKQKAQNSQSGGGSSGGGSSGGGQSAGGGGLSAKVGDAEVSVNAPMLPGAQQKGGEDSDSGSAAQVMKESGFRALDLVKTNAEIATMEAGQLAANVRAKLEFQTQIISFLMQRRFQHSLIAIAFYQKVFKGSHQGLEVGRTQLSQFFQTADITPSMRTLETVAREAQADVRTGMQAVNASYDAGDRWAALERLQEAFTLGEYSPEVNAFSPEKRKVLLGIYRSARDLQRVGELKDYASVEEIVARLNGQAVDFPSAPVLSAMRGAQQASNIALYSAKQAMLAGDKDRAQKEMLQAVTLWPLNPAIKNFSQQAVEKMDASAQSVPLFDLFLSQKNYRQIASQAVEFGMALHQDPVRSEKLREVVSRVSQLDIAIAYAKEALAQKNPYAAWETLLNARAVEPDDPDLARATGQVAARAGEVARLISDGETALAEGRYAGALASFLAGQDIYPASKLCRVGIENASKALLRDESGREVGEELKRIYPETSPISN